MGGVFYQAARPRDRLCIAISCRMVFISPRSGTIGAGLRTATGFTDWARFAGIWFPIVATGFDRGGNGRDPMTWGFVGAGAGFVTDSARGLGAICFCHAGPSGDLGRTSFCVGARVSWAAGFSWAAGSWARGIVIGRA